MPEAKHKLFIATKDDEAIRAISSVLSVSSISITVSKSGMELLSLISYNLPDLIVIGTDVDDINPYELVGIIKKNSITRYVPSIIMSFHNDITKKISAIDAGADGYVEYPFNNEELLSLIHAKLIQHDELYLLSVTDDLTGLFTRKEFFRRVSFEMDSKIHSRVSIAIIDIDHFKNINDSYGHPIGDIVLIRLSKLFKSLQDEGFITARFGGEEFVTVFPGISSSEAKSIIDDVRMQFTSASFTTNAPDKTFYVSFSAGIAEYPHMGSNLSVLLSRADQALYTAKSDGRNRTYIFSPIMARNDKFWEHIKTYKTGKNVYIDPLLHEPLTGYPYLLAVLENLLTSQTPIDSIGVLMIKILPCIDFYQYRGYKNFEYDIENISLLIPKICEIQFPYERYIAMTDLYDFEIAILFPFPSSLKANRTEFNNLCKELALDISLKSIHHQIEIHYSHGLIPFDVNNPKKVLHTIKDIKSHFTPLLSFSGESNVIQSFSTALFNDNHVNEYIFLAPVYDSTLNIRYHHAVSKKLTTAKDYLDIMLKSISTDRDYGRFMTSLQDIVAEQTHRLPLIVNWIPGIDLSVQLEALHGLCMNTSLPSILLSIDEVEMDMFLTEYKAAMSSFHNTTISIAASHCFIGRSLLQHLSTFEISLVILSEHIVRDIQYFKDRIKIVNGLRLFCDQINVPLYAPKILKGEEFRIVNDIEISYFSGQYMEQKSAIAAFSQQYNKGS